MYTTILIGPQQLSYANYFLPPQAPSLSPSLRSPAYHGKFAFKT